MIVQERLNGEFVQYKNTCVLAGYAIANNYFTGAAPKASFTAFAQHFGQDVNIVTPEDFFNTFFPQMKGLDKTGIEKTGTERVLELHWKSLKPFFQDSRERFMAEVVRDVDLLKIAKTLRDKNALWGVGVKPKNGGMVHVITIGAVEDCFIFRNTNGKGLKEAGSLGDILRYFPGHEYVDGAIYMAV